MTYQQITQCRVCGNENLVQVLDLGLQALTGTFPSSIKSKVTTGPLQLVKCHSDKPDNNCGLLQLKHTYNLSELYGENYGYRSSLNHSMISHLHNNIRSLCQKVVLNANDIILDIGSNDATSLKAYSQDKYQLIGIDPAGEKFLHYYPGSIKLIPDFFSEAVVRRVIDDQKAKLITSFSMFYDLENPVEFAQQIASLLHEDGIWACEQSYMPTMLEKNSFDTVCHEHLEYYGLTQLKWLANKVGLDVIDVEFNEANGGSALVIFAKSNGCHSINHAGVEAILAREKDLKLNTLQPYEDFAKRTEKAKELLMAFFTKAKRENKTVMAMGASTKGNVLLQYCSLTTAEIKVIGEVNSDKFGHFTPGTNIPIIPEKEVLAQKPDYLLVLPWHFRDFFVSHQNFADVNLVFPLPLLEIVKQENGEYAT